METNFIDSLFN